MVRQLKEAPMHQLRWILTIAVLLTPVAAFSQDEVVYYHTDAVGSVRMVTDATGAVVARYDYLPFGELWPTSPPNSNPDARQFTGAERDPETGLDYLGARYLRAQSGLFLTPDPGHVGGHVLNPQSWNAYAYGHNNPLRFVDPDGLFVFDPNASQLDMEAFRNGLTAARDACGRLSGVARSSVCESVAAYGIEGDDNGVIVGFGKLAKGIAGEATFLELQDRQPQIRVTFDRNQTGGDPLSLFVAHEGRHVADYQAFWGAVANNPSGALSPTFGIVGGPLDLTKYDIEFRAYNVTANTAKALGVTKHPLLVNGVLVNASAIRKLLAANPYSVTPTNPGPRISGIQK